MNGINVGDNLWYVDNKEVKPFIVNFLNKKEAIMEFEDSFVKKPLAELYNSKESAERKITSQNFLFICREVSKITGEIIVYKLDKEVTDKAMFELGLRGRYNEDLLYFTIKKESFEEYKDLFVKDYQLLIEHSLAVQL